MPRAPRPRNAEATRATLLARATREFADRGYDGARIDAIAQAARINKRMIYVYFDSKAGLYRAVLDACLSRAMELTREDEAEKGASARARAEVIIRRFFAYLADHPEFVRLLMWEALSREHRARAILLPRLEVGLEPLRAIVRHGVEEGAFRADLDPRFFLLSVNALFFGYLTQRHLIEALWRTELDSPAAREAVLRQLLSILLDGTGARP